MVWPFKKEKVIDLTENKKIVMQKVKTAEYKDLSSQDNVSALGFLGNIASASLNDYDELNLKHLKVKIEDVEYKISALRTRLDKLLDRLDLAEKKIDKWERK